jgi:WD40 repeat protein
MVDGALRGALNPEDSLFSNSLAHTAPIEQLVFTPDGRQLHARDQDKRIVTWDLDDLDAPPTTSLDTIQDIASFDGICDSHQLALVQHRGTLQLWDQESDQLLPLIAPDESLFWTDVAISDDGQTVAAASESGPIFVWNTNALDNPPLRLPNTTDSFSWALTLIPNSSLLASAGDDGTILLWSLDNHVDVPPRILTANDAAWRDIGASADGRWLAASSEDEMVYLWDLESPSVEGRVIGQHVDAAATSVTFSSDGRYLASGGDDSNIYLWSLPDLAANIAISSTLVGHERAIRALAFSCDSQQLASAGGDQTIRLWDLQGPLADPQTLPAQESDTTTGHSRQVTSLQFTGPDQLLVSTGRDGQVWAWEWQKPSSQPMLLTSKLEHPPSIAIDATGQRLGTFADDGKLQISSIDGTTQFLQTEITPGGNPTLVLSADGQSVAVAAGENNAQILFWDLRRNINGQRLGEHDGRINRLLFSPDGRTLASAGDDKTIRIWSLNELGSRPLILQGHTGFVDLLAFSPDGRKLASGGSDHKILLWQLNEAETPPVFLHKHQSNIAALAFSQDGRFLASAATNDESLFIWELDNLAEPIRMDESDNGSIRSLAFSPDARILAGGTRSGKILLWPTLAKLAETGCQAVGRNLSWTEWQRYLPDEPYCPICPDLEPHQTAIEAGVYDPASCSPDS